MLTTGPWPDGLSYTKGPSIMTVPMDKLARVRFDDAIADPSPFRSWANMWKQQLLTQDGSATLICETLAQGPIQLDVLYQENNPGARIRENPFNGAGFYRTPSHHFPCRSGDDG